MILALLAAAAVQATPTDLTGINTQAFVQPTWTCGGWPCTDFGGASPICVGYNGVCTGFSPSVRISIPATQGEDLVTLGPSVKCEQHGDDYTCHGPSPDGKVYRLTITLKGKG